MSAKPDCPEFFHTANTRTSGKHIASRDRSSMSAVYTTSPRCAADAITTASVTLAPGVVTSASPAIRAKSYVSGSTVNAVQQTRNGPALAAPPFDNNDGRNGYALLVDERPTPDKPHPFGAAFNGDEGTRVERYSGHSRATESSCSCVGSGRPSDSQASISRRAGICRSMSSSGGASLLRARGSSNAFAIQIPYGRGRRPASLDATSSATKSPRHNQVLQMRYTAFGRFRPFLLHSRGYALLCRD